MQDDQQGPPPDAIDESKEDNVPPPEPKPQNDNSSGSNDKDPSEVDLPNNTGQGAYNDNVFPKDDAD